MLLIIRIGEADCFLPRCLFRDPADDEVELEALQRLHVRLFATPSPFRFRSQLLNELANEVSFDPAGRAAFMDNPRSIFDEPHPKWTAANPLRSAFGIPREPGVSGPIRPRNE